MASTSSLRAQDKAVFNYLENSYSDPEDSSDIRLALNQNQPVDNNRFYARIAKLTGERREAMPRGRPRISQDDNANTMPGQGELAV